MTMSKTLLKKLSEYGVNPWISVKSEDLHYVEYLLQFLLENEHTQTNPATAVHIMRSTGIHPGKILGPSSDFHSLVGYEKGRYWVKGNTKETLENLRKLGMVSDYAN